MAQEIKQKIVLEGEKQYRDAIRDAQRNLKTLRSELKAETAEMGLNATAQQKNEARVKSLQKQIAEQEKIVKANREALAEARKEFGDNLDAIAKYEQRLNESRTALANMRNELGSVGQSFKDVQNSANLATVASNSVAQSLERISGVADTISSSIESVFTGVASRIKETLSAVWESVVDLAARSNNLVDLAGYWNTSVTNIQRYKGAVAEASGSLEDLNSLVTKINYLDGNKVAELTGVSDENYEDKWSYAMAVMDAMSKMGSGERNDVAEQIFGKGFTKALDLLNDWQTVQDNLDKYDSEKGGYGLSEEELKTMSELYDKVNGLKESWQSLKDMATVKLFGSLALDLTGNAQAILDALKDYFNAETPQEREAALAKMEANITDAFKRIGKAISDGIAILSEVGKELQKSDDPVVQALGNILVGLTDALKWMVENQNAVKTAFTTIFGFWLVAKLTTIGTKLASIVSSITLIQAFNAGGAGAAAAGGATAAAGTGLWSKLGAFLTTTGAKVGGGILTFISAMLPNSPLFAQSGNSEDDEFYQALVQGEAGMDDSPFRQTMNEIKEESKKREEEKAKYTVGEDGGIYDAAGNRVGYSMPKSEGEGYQRDGSRKPWGWYQEHGREGTAGEVTAKAEDLFPSVGKLLEDEYGKPILKEGKTEEEADKDAEKEAALNKAGGVVLEAVDTVERVLGKLFTNPLFGQSGNSEDDPIYQAIMRGQMGLEDAPKYSWRKLLEEDETQGQKEQGPFTDAQIQALENYWDVIRGWDSGEEEEEAAWATVEDAFGKNTELLELLEKKFIELYGDDYEARERLTDIPESWYLDEWKGRGAGGNTGNTDGLTGADAKNMTQAVLQMPDQFRRSLSTVKIYMDKDVIGRLIADEVSRQIAAEVE